MTTVHILDAALAGMGEPARTAVQNAIARGAAGYDRERVLPQLIRLSPGKLADTSPRGRLLVIEKLQRAKRAAVNAIRSGHWSADTNRVIALRQAIAAETCALQREQAP